MSPTPHFRHNSEDIRVKTVRLGREIVSLKVSPLGCESRTYDVMSRGNRVIIAKWRPSGILHLEFLDCTTLHEK